MTNILEVSNLTKCFAGKKPFTAVSDVSFAVGESEIVGLLGPNGAGKSTTIQMLLGTLTPSSGSIVYFGKEFASHRSEILTQVGNANGYGRLPWNLNVVENLEIQGMLYGLRGKKLRARIDELIVRFEMTESRKKLCGFLSAGQATRVMLAKAFIGFPRMVLLDEPTAALDPDIGLTIRNFVLEERKQRGVSMIYTSHNMGEVSAVCDRVIFLKGGKVVEIDTPEQLAAKSSQAKLRLKMANNSGGPGYLAGLGLEVSNDQGWTEITLDEHAIANTSCNFSEAGHRYSELEIRKPTLEDYFIKISKEQKNHELV